MKSHMVFGEQISLTITFVIQFEWRKLFAHHYTKMLAGSFLLHLILREHVFIPDLEFEKENVRCFLPTENINILSMRQKASWVSWAECHQALCGRGIWL